MRSGKRFQCSGQGRGRERVPPLGRPSGPGRGARGVWKGTRGEVWAVGAAAGWGRGPPVSGTQDCVGPGLGRRARSGQTECGGTCATQGGVLRAAVGRGNVPWGHVESTGFRTSAFKVGAPPGVQVDLTCGDSGKASVWAPAQGSSRRLSRADLSPHRSQAGAGAVPKPPAGNQEPATAQRRAGAGEGWGRGRTASGVRGTETASMGRPPVGAVTPPVSGVGEPRYTPRQPECRGRIVFWSDTATCWPPGRWRAAGRTGRCPSRCLVRTHVRRAGAGAGVRGDRGSWSGAPRPPGGDGGTCRADR